jgi:hypothetical protein
MIRRDRTRRCVGRGESGSGRIRNMSAGSGAGGDYFYSNCGVRVRHQAATPYYNLLCPQVGRKMVRR